MSSALTTTDVKKALAGKSPDERAKELIDGTKLDDVAVRKQLYEGGEAAVDASTDPLIVLMRQIEPDALAIHQRDEDEVQSVLRRDGGNIGKALFAKEGLSVPPDATFTLRLSYGAVEGYKLNGKNVPWFTTMGGAYKHAAEHGSKPPYQLPESWLKAKSSIDLKTPLIRFPRPTSSAATPAVRSSTRTPRWWESSSMATSSRCRGTSCTATRWRAPSKWTRGRSWSRCATSTTPTLWPTS